MLQQHTHHKAVTHIYVTDGADREHGVEGVLIAHNDRVVLPWVRHD